MTQKAVNFDDKKINKNTFYKNNKLFSIHDIDTEKILVSKKESYGKKGSLKYFIGYNDEDSTIRPLTIKFPQMIGCIKHFDDNKTISFKLNDKKLLKKYNNIWETIADFLDVQFDSDPVYGDNEKYIKTKIRIYEDRVISNFQGKKYQKKMHHIIVLHWLQ